MLRVSDDAQGGVGIIMQTLLYADEVRPFSEIPIPDAEVRESEVKLAKQLVDQIGAETFNPADYEDDVRKRIQADIDRKIAGKEIATAPNPPEGGRVIDLMEALKASLGEGRRPAKAPSEADETAEPIASLAKAVDGVPGRKPARRAAGDAAPTVAPEARKRASKR
jgi:DNA end-binding protein Ku